MTTRDSLRVLTTGASRGLGRALAVELTARGHAVVATARNTDDLADLDVDQRLRLDVTDFDTVAAAISSAEPLDVVVNNAGTTTTGPTELLTARDIQSVLDVNILGPVRVAQAVTPRMRQRGHGKIVQISSVAARFTPPLQGSYAASKAALERLSDALRFELGPFGISVGIVVIGALATDMATDGAVINAPPYEPLVEEVHSRLQRHQSAAASPRAVAARIADVIERGELPARLHVGKPQERLFARLPSALQTRLGAAGLHW